MSRKTKGIADLKKELEAVKEQLAKRKEVEAKAIGEYILKTCEVDSLDAFKAGFAIQKRTGGDAV